MKRQKNNIADAEAVFEDPLSITSNGLLLYPSVGMDVDETALIQGHRLRFVTIDRNRPVATACLSVG